ncbi:MAG: hypothetical protein AAF560_18880 [Acidobacteriota bacterium]
MTTKTLTIEVAVERVAIDHASLTASFVRASLSGDHVTTGTTPEGFPFTTVTLPPSDEGDTTIINFLIEGEEAAFGSSPVEWVELDTNKLDFWRPVVPNPDEVVAVERLSAQQCRVTLVNPGHASTYRFMLVVFRHGQAGFADPTIINPPDEDPDPGGES